MSKLARIAAVALAISGAGAFGCASTRTQESAGEFVDDSVITTRVKAALLAEPDLKSLPIGVETFKGVVQLSGFVDTAAHALRAAELAARVPGVTRVKNDLTVK